MLSKKQNISSMDSVLSLMLLSSLLLMAGNTALFSSCKPTAEILLSAAVAAIIGGALTSGLVIAARQFNNTERLQYLARIAVRYLLAYFMVYYALIFTEGEYWDYPLTMQEMQIVDLKPQDYVYLFMGYSKELPLLIGGGMLLSAMLLVFRSTQAIGSVLGLGLWTALMTTDLLFSRCTAPVSTTMVATTLYILLPYTSRLWAAASGKTINQVVSWPILGKQHHLYRSIGILKVVVLVGVMSHIANGIWRSQHYFRSNDDSPIVGVWDVVDIQYQSDTGELARDTIPAELASFKSLFLDESRWGAVKVDEDTLSRFEYIVDSSYNQLEFWNFWEFKELDLKGKYHFADTDTLIYEATNRKENLRMVLKRNPKYKARADR